MKEDGKMRLCIKCRKLSPERTWGKFLSKVVMRYYFKSYCPKCREKITADCRKRSPLFKKVRAAQNKRYYEKHKIPPLPKSD